MGKLFCFNGAERNFSNYFSVHVSGACPDAYRDYFSGVYPELDSGLRKVRNAFIFQRMFFLPAGRQVVTFLQRKVK